MFGGEGFPELNLYSCKILIKKGNEPGYENFNPIDNNDLDYFYSYIHGT